MKTCERCGREYAKLARETYKRYEERRICHDCGLNPLSLKERFWQKVDKNGPVPVHCPELGNCWVWITSKHQFGYGEVFTGIPHPEGSHRVAWKLAHGSIPHGMHVLHRCDNPPCVRPDHLFLGTHKENMQDMTAKGRHAVFDPTKERKGGSKLTRIQAAEIRERMAAGERTAVLAVEYDMSWSKISDIATGKSWIYAGGPILQRQQLDYTLSGDGVCIECSRRQDLKARGLCGACWKRHRLQGTLDQFPTTRTWKVKT
jgi:hypothetical protein